jgi:hypothetical protein
LFLRLLLSLLHPKFPVTKTDKFPTIHLRHPHRRLMTKLCPLQHLWVNLKPKHDHRRHRRHMNQILLHRRRPQSLNQLM